MSFATESLFEAVKGTMAPFVKLHPLRKAPIGCGYKLYYTGQLRNIMLQLPSLTALLFNVGCDPLLVTLIESWSVPLP